ncbi:imidazole glycerol phosphate synthase subunit HisH [Chitinivorax sp. B]|uniref:imidazole glycerol phosphate synthase subunit HisH n=1 Tax=Chitinivorax sp. B TaxID=2502235 RepID=UPI0010F434A3|nr:imidazole glycerol phosphate synthase subunit HisH [Chitinivorax sp. B]
MSLRIGIADYGIGNMRSVCNAILAAGGQADIVTDPNALRRYDKLILPGVGAFGDAARQLQDSGMAAALTELQRAGKDIMGICLGMQLMCIDSSEDGLHQGLGWFDAHVRRFPDQLGQKVPHIGWNDLSFPRNHPVLLDLTAHPDVYFVHSYRVEATDATDVLAWCDYGEPFAAMIARDNLIGIQFHPEKSQRIGLAILKNFIITQTAVSVPREAEALAC